MHESQFTVTKAKFMFYLLFVSDPVFNSKISGHKHDGCEKEFTVVCSVGSFKLKLLFCLIDINIPLLIFLYIQILS